ANVGRLDSDGRPSFAAVSADKNDGSTCRARHVAIYAAKIHKIIGHIWMCLYHIHAKHARNSWRRQLEERHAHIRGNEMFAGVRDGECLAGYQTHDAPVLTMPTYPMWVVRIFVNAGVLDARRIGHRDPGVAFVFAGE